MNNLAVFESDMGKGAAHLGTQLHTLHRGELTEELQSRLKFALKRHADPNDWRCRCSYVIGGMGQQPLSEDNQSHNNPDTDCESHPKLTAGLAYASSWLSLG